MRTEIQSASNFLTNLLRLRGPRNAHFEQFAARLEQLLCEHYCHHWFPEKPNRGSGYRCIRINHKMDPILSRAGTECGFDDDGLRDFFPSELTLWIDPCEVSYRIGENGSICILYQADTPRVTLSPWTPTPPRPVAGRRWGGSSDEDDSCSSMSVSPPSPNVSCKESVGFIMDPRNINLELSTYVAS